MRHQRLRSSSAQLSIQASKKELSGRSLGGFPSERKVGTSQGELAVSDGVGRPTESATEKKTTCLQRQETVKR
jgi:hypothetical protein